ncbi:ParB/RepB/Spo0J family partition protein [Negativicoccus succinicivorans]|uniref:ParB/RepB/Spo0J family partition protein n=1 Tax=Negativicoccus succinicivorans TaxID=620903 RepID=UPI0028FEAFCB|nr:ParB/RepB/Spo0J family partition protein [Negativicoccus succinicivorans]MDU2417653.1 ParB/RepB/Spo0J family partition protein [Negativicoccus succinicivorans]
MVKKGMKLGRGLDSLLPGSESVAQNAVQEIVLTEIVPNPQQPRQEFAENELNDLAASIKEYGIIQPLIVMKVGDGYQLVAGERRLRAAKIAKLRTVPVIIRDYDDAALAAVALIENLQREDLNPIEEAAAYYRLRDEFSLTQAQIATKVGRSRPYITNMMRLLQLPDFVRELLARRELTVGQVRPLLVVEDPDAQVRWAQKIVAEGLSARQVEALLAKAKTPAVKPPKQKKAKKSDANVEAYLDAESEELTLLLGTKVDITAQGSGSKTHGEIRIPYANWDELERLLTLLK